MDIQSFLLFWAITTLAAYLLSLSDYDMLCEIFGDWAWPWRLIPVVSLAGILLGLLTIGFDIFTGNIKFRNNE